MSCEKINYAQDVSTSCGPIAVHIQGCTEGTYLYAVKGLFGIGGTSSSLGSSTGAALADIIAMQLRLRL
jgi:hypothetical protein